MARTIVALLLIACAADPASAAQARPPDGLPVEISVLVDAALVGTGSAVDDLVAHVLAAPLDEQRLTLIRLQRERGPAVAEVARQMLDKGPPTLQHAAIMALRVAPPDTSDLALLRRLAERGEDLNARAAAVGGLGEMGDLRSAAYLIELLSDREPRLVEAARVGLEAISGVSYGDDLVAWQTWLQQAEKTADELLPILSQKLADPDLSEVRSAIARLSIMSAQKAEAVELLTPMVQHADPEIGMLASESLRTLGAPVPERTTVDLVVEPVAQRSVVAGAASLIVGRPLSDKLGALIGGALVIGVIGGVAMLVFLMRTREAATKVAKGLTRRMVNGAKGATRAIKKKITFTS